MDDPIEQALAQAQQLITQGKWDEALALLQRLAQAAPQNVQIWQTIAQLSDKKGDITGAINAYLRWAQLCQSRGQLDDALRLYNHVLSMEAGADKRGPFKGAGADPERIRELLSQYRSEISLQMGSIFLQKNQADEAIRCLRLALDSPSGAQDSRVHTLLGIAYMQKKMDKEAVGEFQEVVRLAPNEAAFAYEKLGEIFIRGGKPPQSTIVWFRNAGDLYLRNEQRADAIRAYEMILSFEKRNKDVLNRLADIYTQQGLRDKALDTYRNLALIYTEEGLLDKVIILYEKLTDLNPEDHESWEKLVEIYNGILQRDSSNLSVRLKLIKYLVLKNEMESAIPEYLALAASYFEKGIYDESVQVIQKLLELDPHNIRGREMLGDIYMKREESERALAEYLEVVKLYRDAGDEQKSLAFSQRLMEIFPQEGELHYQLARSFKDQGLYKEALKELEQVLEQNPDHVPAMCDAAEMLTQLERLDEARAMYGLILEREPDRTDIRMHMLDFYLRDNDLANARGQVDRLTAALQERGLFKEAERLYLRLLAYYPENEEIREKIAELRLAQGDVERVIHEWLLLATMFVRRKMLERAAMMYAKILEARPEHLNARYRLGRVLAQQGLKPQALEHLARLGDEYRRRNLTMQAVNVLQETVELDPENVQERARLVDLLVGQLRIEEATAQYKHLIRTHMQAGSFEEAGGRIKEVISLQPRQLDLRLELASMYLEYNQLQEGQELLEELVSAYLQKKQVHKVIDIYGKMAQIFRLQGRWDLYWQIRERAAELCRQEGQTVEAISEYQEIIEGVLRAGQFDHAHRIFPVLSDLYFESGRAEEGLHAFERVVETLSRDGNAREASVAQDFLIKLLERAGDRGHALELLLQIAERGLETGDRELALATYGRIASLLVEMQDVERAVATQFIRVGLLLRGKDYGAAREIYNEIRSLRPDVLADEARFAELLYDAEYFEEALPLFVEIMDRDPANMEARARVAVIYAREGEMVQSARIARNLLSQGLLDKIVDEFKRSTADADEGDVGLRLGAFYEEMGFFEEALHEYQRAARQQRATLAAGNAMAFLFRRAGYVDLAVRQFIRTLEQPGYEDEDLLDTRYHLAQLYQDTGRYMEALSMFNEVSAVKLRYRDVADRIEELSALIASGGARAEVIPFAPHHAAGPAASPAADAVPVKPAVLTPVAEVAPPAVPAPASEAASPAEAGPVVETSPGPEADEPEAVSEPSLSPVDSVADETEEIPADLEGEASAVASEEPVEATELVSAEPELIDEGAEEALRAAPGEDGAEPVVESAAPVSPQAAAPSAGLLEGGDDFFLEGPPPS